MTLISTKRKLVAFNQRGLTCYLLKIKLLLQPNMTYVSSTGDEIVAISTKDDLYIRAIFLRYRIVTTIKDYLVAVY